MKSFIDFIGAMLIGMLLSGLLVWGEDREIARQDFEKAWNEHKFNTEITGCLFDVNCDHYTEMLKK